MLKVACVFLIIMVDGMILPLKFIMTAPADMWVWIRSLSNSCIPKIDKYCLLSKLQCNYLQNKEISPQPQCHSVKCHRSVK